jgi:HlyD family secretion protein
MFKKWLLPSAIVVSILLVGANTYVLLKKDETFSRTTITDSITSIKKEDFQLFLPGKGLVVASNIKKVFIDTQPGMIDQVLVKKGQSIQTGTPLVQLKNDDIDHQISQLESKINELQNQLDEIEQTIRDLENYKQDLLQNEEEYIALQETEILGEIRELQTEQRMMDLKIKDYESEVDVLEKKKQKFVIKSNTAGIVEEVHLEGNYPFISILTPPYLIEGEISEFHLKKIEEGQKVKITSSLDPKTEYTGKVMEISKLPSTIPTLHNKESFYPYYVEFDKNEKLSYGSHVQLAIVMKESENALSIPKTAVIRQGKKEFVYVVKNGKLEKHKIKLGISNGTRQEVTSGLSESDWIIANPPTSIKEGMLVASPLQAEKIEKKLLKQLSKSKIAELILKGFLKNDATNL